MIVFLVRSQIVMNLASCDFCHVPENICQFYFNSIDFTAPSGPDMKYSLLSVLSKWADSQFGFWTILDSVQFMNYQSKWLIQ